MARPVLSTLCLLQGVDDVNIMAARRNGGGCDSSYGHSVVTDITAFQLT